MKIIKDKITLEELKKYQNLFGDFVKIVIDIEKGIMVVGGEMHADEEKLLIEDGSKQENLWGANIYPEIKKDEWIEFDSMINIRPWQNNRSRSIESVEIQGKIIQIINKLLCS